MSQLKGNRSKLFHYFIYSEFNNNVLGLILMRLLLQAFFWKSTINELSNEYYR